MSSRKLTTSLLLALAASLSANTAVAQGEEPAAPATAPSATPAPAAPPAPAASPADPARANAAPQATTATPPGASPAATTHAVAASPVTQQPAASEFPKVRPYAIVVGGTKAQFIQQPSNKHQQNRITTVAMARFGLRGDLTTWADIESEFDFNAGPHGTSAFEGQAAIQVRDQRLRLKRGIWEAQVGRITDIASLDFFSAHVADMLLTDGYTRDPLLYSGFNRGDGVLGRIEVLPNLKIGLTVNAANPTSTTSSLMVGGTLPPWDRVYSQAAIYIKDNPSRYPDDSFHMMIATPSIVLEEKFVDIRTAAQLYWVDTQMNESDDDRIRGYNVRAALRLKLLSDKLSPFINYSANRNDMLDRNNPKLRSSEKFVSMTVGGGVDFNYWKNNGVGAQYTLVQYKVGRSYVTSLHYVNVGTTWWLHERIAAGLRFAFGLRNEDRKGYENEGERAVFLTLRGIL